jgi:hypothetical protein
LKISLKNKNSILTKLKESKNDNTINKLFVNEITKFSKPISKVKEINIIDFDTDEMDKLFYNNPNYLNLAIRHSKNLTQIRTDVL